MLFIILDEQNSGTRYYQESMDHSKIYKMDCITIKTKGCQG